MFSRKKIYETNQFFQKIDVLFFAVLSDNDDKKNIGYD